MRNSILALTAGLVFVAALRAAAPPSEAPVADFERARTLLAEGKHAEALAALTAYRKALPPDARLTRWSLDFEGRAVPVVLIGKKHLYFTFNCSRREKVEPPGVPDARPLLDDKTGVYDFNTVITCVHAATGQRLWSRRTPGLCEIALDPRNDDLYVWREKLFRLKPETGDVDQEKQFPGRPARIEALIVAGRPYVPRPQHPLPYDEPGKALRTYNVDTGEIAERDVLQAHRLSPDESRRLVFSLSYAKGVHTQVSAEPIKEKVLPWKYEHADYSYNEPFWMGDDVVAMNGNETGKAEVVRLNGADGTLKWRFALPRGAYAPGRDQLPGNGYPDRVWRAVGTCGEHMLALGGEGTLYFLDAATGKLRHRAALATDHLALPRIVEGGLIVCSIKGIRAVPMDVVEKRRPHDERHVLLVQAQCLHGLGKIKEGMAVLSELLERDPEFVEGWAARAELNRTAELPQEEIAARCRQLELTGKAVSPELRERWGLLRRIATEGDITADVRQVGNTVYAGTRSGWLYGINARSLEVVEKKEFPAALVGMTRSARLKSYFLDRQEREPAERSDDAEPGPAKAPAEWTTVTGYDGRAIRWQGKYYRPLGGGNVRVLDGETISEFKTRLGGIERWQIDVSPAGLLGYGSGGVYELDKDLCPVRHLIELRNAERPLDAVLLASDLRTLGLLTSHGRFQIWTRDGTRKLREQVLSPPGYLRGFGDNLVALGGGYLVSAGDLAWLSPSADVPVWRFGFGDHPSRALPKTHFAHTTLFGRPLLSGHLLFVPCRDGAIYVFDVNAITRAGQR